MLQVIGVQGAWAFTDRSLVLVAQTRAPLVQTEQGPYDPNSDIVSHLTHYLKELHKVDVITYSPQHPTVQRFAHEKNLKPDALESPDAPLLLQIGRALDATFVLIVRCTRQRENGALEYQAEVWQPGRRTPIWRTRGTQQTFKRDTDQEAALKSLTRTIALRLDTELWNQLPRMPAPPSAQGEPLPSRSTEQKEPAKARSSSAGAGTTEVRDPNKLIGEGRLHEALPLLRAAVNQNPLDTTLRLQLIELYQRLGMRGAALDECERAMRLMPHSEPLVPRWAQLMREQGRVADAIRTLKEMLQAEGGLTLALLLFDLQLRSGDFAGAEATLATMRPTSAPEVRWCAYLMQGVKRRFDRGHEGQPLTQERLPALLFVVSGVMNDLANELLDLKRLANDPVPDWKLLRERGEQIVIKALDFGAWLGQLRSDESTHDAHAHLQFGAYLMGQAAQQMARYLLLRKEEDLEQATLLRTEALRELDAAMQQSELTFQPSPPL